MTQDDESKPDDDGDALAKALHERWQRATDTPFTLYDRNKISDIVISIGSLLSMLGPKEEGPERERFRAVMLRLLDDTKDLLNSYTPDYQSKGKKNDPR